MSHPEASFFTCDFRGIGESKPVIHRPERIYLENESWDAWPLSRFVWNALIC